MWYLYLKRSSEFKKMSKKTEMEVELDAILEKEIGILRKRILVLMTRREKRIVRDTERAVKSSYAPSRSRAPVKSKSTNVSESRSRTKVEKEVTSRSNAPSKNKYRRASESRSRSRSLSSSESD